MPSFYNIIKNNSSEENGKRVISTTYTIENKKKSEGIGEVTNKDIVVPEYNPLEEYEALKKTILEEARREAEEIRKKAMEEIEEIKSSAYNEAYDIGYKEGKDIGQEEGFKKAYEDTVEKAKEESNLIISSANNVLFSAKEEYEAYLKRKKDEILDLSLHIASQVLNTEIKKPEALDETVLKLIRESSRAKSYIIRCREIYRDNINEKILNMKEILGLSNGEIFVVKDNSVEEGKVIIEKDNGKIESSIDKALEEIKKELF